MTYANLPYPDLPSLPAFLTQNPYQRRPYYQPAQNANNFQPELEPPDIPPRLEEDESVEDVMPSEDKLSLEEPLQRLTHHLFSYDDPERTAFFVPLMILLVVHAMFLIYLHVYAPIVEEGKATQAALWVYSLSGRRYYDVDRLKNTIL